MSFNISYTFEALDRFTGTARKISSALKQVRNNVMNVRMRFEALGKSLSSIGKRFSLTLTAPLVALGGYAIKASADVEQLTVAFSSMTHSVASGKKLVQDLINFTAKTPFQLPGVADAAQRLLTFGVQSNKVIPILRQLSNIAAMTHTPMSELAQQYGRVAALGKVTTRELMQLSAMRVPIVTTLQQMAKEAGHAGVNIQDIASKNLITFPVFLEALRRMTTGTGIFTDAAKKQSQTLTGLFSTLKDNIRLTLIPFGDIIVDTLKLQTKMQKLIDTLGVLRENFKVWAQAHPALLKLIVYTGLFLAALGPVLLILGQIAFGISAIIALFNPWIVLIEVLIAGVTYLYIKFKPVRDIIAEILHGIMKSIDAIKEFGHWVGKIYEKGKYEVGKVGMGGMMDRPSLLQQTISFLKQPVQRVDSNLNISVHDPGNRVNYVRGTSTGDMNFSLGTNFGVGG
jgi:hypothetical protein